MSASSLHLIAGIASAALALGLVFWAMHRRRERTRGRTIGLLAGTIDRSHLAVMITDLETRIRYVNAGSRRLSGYEDRELLGRSWHEFRQPETGDDLLADLVVTVRGGNTWTGDWFNRTKTGELYRARGLVTPLRDASGDITHFATIFEKAVDSSPAGGAGLALKDLPGLQGPALTAALRQCLERRTE
jgi:PAS domain S-box-containing protein